MVPAREEDGARPSLIILTQYYPPESGAPQRRLSDLARRLSRMGFRVTTLTAMPNYPDGRVQAAYRGKVYMRETREGIVVHRAWVFATKSRRVLVRLLNYFSFVGTSVIVGALRLGRANVLLIETPPLFLGLAGLLLARLKGARLVINVADPWLKAARSAGHD